MELDCEELGGRERPKRVQLQSACVKAVKAVHTKRKRQGNGNDGSTSAKKAFTMKRPVASAQSLSPWPVEASYNSTAEFEEQKGEEQSEQTLRCGPTSVDDALMWPLHAVEMMRVAGLLPTLLDKLQGCGVDVSTDYSGCGQAETACGFIVSALQHLDYDVGKGLPCTRSGDISEHRRAFLLNHLGMADGCIFGDIVSRMRVEHRNLLTELLQAHRSERLEAGDCVADVPGGGCDAEDDADLHDAAEVPHPASVAGLDAEACPEKPALGLVDGIVGLVKQAQSDWLQDPQTLETAKAFCHRCRKFCPVFPRGHTQISACDKEDDADRAAPPHQRSLRLHVSGVSCIDWSSRGKHSKWARKTTYAYVQWMIERSICQEDIIIVECTRLFDTSILESVLQNYKVMSTIYSPLQLGLGINRYRVYVLCVKNSLLWPDGLSFGDVLKEVLDLNWPWAGGKETAQSAGARKQCLARPETLHLSKF